MVAAITLLEAVPANSQSLDWVRPSILKINVQTDEIVPEVNGHGDICPSEGTAVIVGDRYAVTAAHVVTRDKRCGNIKQIIGRSFLTQNQGQPIVMDLLATSGADVAVLELSDATIPLNSCENSACYCAMKASPADLIHAQEVLRFGIAATLERIEPRKGTIAPGSNGFYELELSSKDGFSGGPVMLTEGALIGIMSRNVDAADQLTYVTPVKQVRSLLVKKNVGDPSHAELCNPLLLGNYEVPGIRIVETDSSTKINIEFEREVSKYGAGTINAIRSVAEGYLDGPILIQSTSGTTLTLIAAKTVNYSATYDNESLTADATTTTVATDSASVATDYAADPDYEAGASAAGTSDAQGATDTGGAPEGTLATSASPSDSDPMSPETTTWRCRGLTGFNDSVCSEDISSAPSFETDSVLEPMVNEFEALSSKIRDEVGRTLRSGAIEELR
ncbi:serine protease [uncultured Paracoccus sp.]|uniref:S1 family peptidase n=1 Tax=uncultured Paracoccus sp. TaxID=189685 RepID=UPI00261BD489|nr:serine protease [uncultured Paracoccus sp.]